MPLPEAFWEQLPQKSNEELCEVLLHQDDYLPEALVAVKEEMRKRNLSPKSVAEIAAAAAQAHMLAAQTEAHERQRRHLGTFAVHAFLWLAIPLILLIKALISLLMAP
jgi:hypothetical protein